MNGSSSCAFTRIALRGDHDGTEAEVGRRFKDRLELINGCRIDVVEHTLFDNFRTYINDVAKVPDKTIDRPNFSLAA